ncbi:LuxR C-terminal-related transcriptional regulator [Paraburkholderia fungorum]|uniref:Helix-turn-helix transcriptional regulator n=1 Tax=Paraburkholderia fungorum TaxID=134537 RepID=A0A3R7L7L8_9BURK|nr:LuxR C-terminal-related transcriptional regulator [Paraburkholderia fungorum]RKF35872.1 helix-turn-helix transcriptional regulator [Paraburkholderia fungorum]
MHVIAATKTANAPPLNRSPLVLATKVFPPRLPAGLIDRPRLASLAGQTETKRLTVIKAPAGFGKTSLALTWLKLLGTTSARVAWLSLDADDDEPGRFFNHLAHALRQACGNVGAAVIGLTAEASFVPVSSLAATLINELVDVDDEVYLFIDDYHLITEAPIHEAMSLFIANAPSQVHVVLCTRTDPPFPTAKLRAHNELLEIDASTLRFNFDETRRFVEHECPGKLGSTDVKSLFATTEGWAAALRISSSVLARKDRPRGWRTSAPSGASRPLADYLEDILQSLPVGMLEFMLRTAILDRLSAPLCEALTGLAPSQAMLDAIVARQLLLEPLDLEGHWFRYHPLMAEYLQRRLEAVHHEEIDGLHRRAWQWYAAHHQWTDAVRHAIAAGATGDAIRLMEHCAMSLLKGGDLLTLVGWQRQFPADLMRAQITVTLAIAWGTVLALRFDDAVAMLDSIEHDAAHKQIDADHVRSECVALRSTLAALQDDPQRALALTQAYLERPSRDSWTTNVVSNVARFCHWKAGDLDALHATPWIPDSIAEDQRSVFSTVYRLCLLGHVEMQQLRCPLAERRFNEAMDLAEQHSGPQSIAAALCAPMLAQLRYEQGRLDEAEALIVELMPVIELAVFLDSVLIAYRVLLRIAVARGNFTRAHALLDTAQELGQSRRWNRLVAAGLSERIRLHLAEGRFAEASACVAQLRQLAAANAGSSVPVSPEIENYRDLGAASLAIRQRQTQEAVTILNGALARLEHLHGAYLALRLRTLLALAWLNAGERDRALEIFHQVATVAAPAGICQSIVDQGPEIGPLLKLARESTRAATTKEAKAQEIVVWLDRLLDSWRALHEPNSQAPRESERERLSSRERGIVELIAQGQSNKEIARTLGITPETVKSHVKSIFMKLEVDKRAQAVARAQALGLVKHG